MTWPRTLVNSWLDSMRLIKALAEQSNVLGSCSRARNLNLSAHISISISISHNIMIQILTIIMVVSTVSEDLRTAYLLAKLEAWERD